MRIKSYHWAIVLCLILGGSLVGCGGNSSGAKIRWVEGGGVSMAAITTQGISGPYVGYVPSPYVGGGFAAICEDGGGDPVAANWSLSKPLMNLDPPSGMISSISCEPITMGDCVITAVTASGDVATANVRILGNVFLSWLYMQRTNPVYFKIRKSGHAQVYSREEADVVMNVSNYPGWSLEFVGGKGKAYTELEGYAPLQSLVPDASELIESTATHPLFAFENADGEIVSAFVSGYSNAGGVATSFVSILFWIQE